MMQSFNTSPRLHSKLCVILLSLVVVVCVALGVIFLMPNVQTVNAQTIDHDTSHSGWTAITDAGGTLSDGKYYLDKDVKLTNNITINGTITLCLNGYTLTGTGSGSVITADIGQNFTLCDCSLHNAGKITGGNTTNGSGVYIGGDSLFTMKGGTITGNTASKDGGGVRVYGGTFIMEGGVISGNTADSGGGVYVASAGGTFTMKGGTIGGNTAAFGGGVYVGGQSTFIMEGGVISGNTAGSYGGGVYMGSTFQMYGGMICDGAYANIRDCQIYDGYFAGEVDRYISVSGGYFSSESVNSRIPSGYTVVNISELSGTSFDSAYAEDFPYAVYSQGTFTVNDVKTTYGTDYLPTVNGILYNAVVSYSYESEGDSVEGLPTAVGKYTVAAEMEKPLLIGKTYYADTNTFTVEILPKPLSVQIDVGYTTGENGEIDGAEINSLSYTGVLDGEKVTIAPTTSLVRDNKEKVVGVNVNFTLGGANAGNYVARDMYIEIHNDMNSIIAELDKQIASLEQMIGNVSGDDLQKQITDINNLIIKAVNAFDNANITDLADGISDLVARLETLESTVGTIHDNYITDSELESAVENLDRTVTAAYQAAIESLQTDVAANTEDIKTLYAIVWVLVAIVGAMLVGGVIYFIISRKKCS